MKLITKIQTENEKCERRSRRMLSVKTYSMTLMLAFPFSIFYTCVIFVFVFIVDVVVQLLTATATTYDILYQYTYTSEPHNIVLSQQKKIKLAVKSIIATLVETSVVY